MAARIQIGQMAEMVQCDLQNKLHKRRGGQIQ